MSESISRFFQKRWAGILGHCRNLRGESGNAIVEMAVILAFLGPPLLFGTTDMAMLLYSSIEISNAAHAGAMFAMTDPNVATDTADITLAAQADASDYGTKLTVTPTAYYACSSAQDGVQYPVTTDGSGLASAVAACPSTAVNHYLEYVQVVVSAPVTLPFSCCGLKSPVTLTRSSVMEVE